MGWGQASVGGLGEAPPPAEAEPAGRRRVYQVDWDIVGGGGGASLCRGLYPMKPQGGDGNRRASAVTMAKGSHQD